MIILFLDIDGVFTSGRTGWYNFNIYAVNFIRWICKKDTKIQCVISSTWRQNHNKKYFESIFGNILHDDWRTVKKLSSTRGQEIGIWLHDHPDVADFLIIDDDKDMGTLSPHLIQTDSYDGMLTRDMIKILDRLNVDGNFYEDIDKEFIITRNMFQSTNVIFDNESFIDIWKSRYYECWHEKHKMEEELKRLQKIIKDSDLEGPIFKSK